MEGCGGVEQTEREKKRWKEKRLEKKKKWIERNSVTQKRKLKRKEKIEWVKEEMNGGESEKKGEEGFEIWETGENILP